MRFVLVERFAPVIPGIGADVLADTSTLGDDVIRADITEAEAIMAARGFDVDPFLALESSGGWIAGLVLEPGRGNPATSGRLATYLAADVRPRLHPDEDAFLVRCSVFDRVDRERAVALAGEAGPAMVDALRLAGVPGVWDERARELRMHPRIREVLGEERRDRTDGRASGRLDECGRVVRARRRHQARSRRADRGRRSRRGQEALAVRDHGGDRAARLRGGGAALSAVPMDPEPPEVMYARLCLAVVVQAAAGALPVLAALERDGTAADVFAKLPAAGAIVVLMYSAIGRVAEAFAALEHIPPGRAYDTARLILAHDRDDPDAPVPAFAGDMLDALIARGLYWRGQIGELQRITSTTLAELSGVPDLADRSANTCTWRTTNPAACRARSTAGTSRSTASAVSPKKSRSRVWRRTSPRTISAAPPASAKPLASAKPAMISATCSCSGLSTYAARRRRSIQPVHASRTAGGSTSSSQSSSSRSAST